MAMRTVRMVHERVRGTYDAPERAVGHWEARGWRREDEKAPAPVAKATAKATDKKDGA